MTEKKAYEFTCYPKIYKTSYWGNFTRGINTTISDEIIENRNSFILNNNIKNYRCPRYLEEEIWEMRREMIDIRFDHMEFYLTENRTYVVICSLYGPFNDKVVHLGWTPINKLYSTQAHTFMKTFPFKYKRF
jgi:hypothetical protein